MQKILLCLMALTILSCGAIKPDGEADESAKLKYADQIKSEDLQEHLYLLSSDILRGRKTGEKGQKMAVNYVTAYYEHLGLLPPATYPEYTQTIPQDSCEGQSKGPSKNILAYIEGTEFPNEVLVISAHYDHLGTKN